MTKAKVDSGIEAFVKARGAGQPSASTLAAAVMAPMLQTRRKEVVESMALACGRFSCQLVAEALGEITSSMDAENFAEAICGHVSDAENFESVVVEGTQLKDMFSSSKARLLQTAKAANA